MANDRFQYKIGLFHFRNFTILARLLLSTLWFFSCAPKPEKVGPNEYGLKVIKKPGTYKYLAIANSGPVLVDLDAWIKPLRTDLVYATPNNFTGKVLYYRPRTYLRLEAAKALQKVQDSLQQLGLDIRIFDAYRPYSVTREMWKIVPDDRYAANPAGGSGHNRGIAVDLTLTDSAGNALEMPTGFDNFSDSAHHDFILLKQQVILNRGLLKRVMEQYGFKALSTEWWHYSLPDPKRYELLDLSFNKLRSLLK